MKLASILALVLLSVSCDKYYCPDHWVPGDIPACWKLEVSDMTMLPTPKSSTIACEIRPSHTADQLGSVAKDGTVHWFWQEEHMNPRMQDKIRQACKAAVQANRAKLAIPKCFMWDKPNPRLVGATDFNPPEHPIDPNLWRIDSGYGGGWTPGSKFKYDVMDIPGALKYVSMAWLMPDGGIKSCNWNQSWIPLAPGLPDWWPIPPEHPLKPNKGRST